MRAQVLSPPAPGADSFVGAAADSREVKPGCLFFALPGERVDGFNYCAAAVKAGARAVVVTADRGLPVGCDGAAVLAVTDVRLALADVARAVRRDFRGKVVGVTGSNGKTTTKELIAAALSPAGVVLKTAGNFNTDVGLPLTVLGSTGTEAFWVLEMAMRARGEIGFLAEIAAPHVGVVTNVAAAHLGKLGSLDEVARAKGEIFQHLGSDGIGVLPVGDARLEAEAAHLPEGRKHRFGPGGSVSVLDFVPAGAAGATVRFAVRNVPVVARLALAGEHNARNAAAALLVASLLGVAPGSAAAAMAQTALPPHRSSVLALGGRTILDDCYNANPASMSAALRMLISAAGASGQAFAVLGDMLELGPDAEVLHVALGREAAAGKLAGLAVVGDLGAHIARGAREAGLAADRVFTAAEPEAAAERVAAWSRPGDWVLVKASRGMRLERVVATLQRRLGRQED